MISEDVTHAPDLSIAALRKDDPKLRGAQAFNLTGL